MKDAGAPAAEHANVDDDAAWSRAARERLTASDAALHARFDAEEDIERLLFARSAAVDAIVREAWARVMGDADAPALFAVGGYARGEFFPHSDIDVLVLADALAQARHAQAVARFVAMLWDCGLKPGHAMRSLEQTTQAAADDITVMTALMDARQLAGDAAAIHALRDAISPQRVWLPHAYFVAKREEVQRRHARFGNTADNLEPNLKEGPGGLRDVQTMRWMAMRVSGTHDLQSLIALGQLGDDEYATLNRERLALSRLRWGLHLIAGKAEERLRFDHQKSLAARLGHIDDADNLAVEQMMQGFYRSAALIGRISDRLLQRFEEQLEGEAEPVAIDAQSELRRGYLAARDTTWPDGDPAAIFALFAAWAHDPSIHGLHSRTARALAESLRIVPVFDAATPALHDAFMALLRGPQPVATLERMARLGVLGRYLPAFARVSGRMQFDLFHVYTVDQHTLAVLRNVAAFAAETPDERFSMAHDIWPRLRKPELLLLAALFHDIAKGRGGDHAELGAVDAREFCNAHALSPPDCELVAWLVQQHLLMSMTAQKSDISDPQVLHRFAMTVADRERLDYLYLLTCADIAGTSPKLWNAWKDRLMADLYVGTRLALRRGLEHPVAAAERITDTRIAACQLLRDAGHADDVIDAWFERMPQEIFLRGHPDQVAWQASALPMGTNASPVVRARKTSARDTGELDVFVHAPDRDGLFAAIVIALDRMGLAIQQARVLDGPDRHVFDTFVVMPMDPTRKLQAQDVEQRLSAAIAGDLDRVQPARRTQPRNLRHFRIAPQIAFDPGAKNRTILSLVCNDRPGLLADIAQTFRAHHLRVHDARIATFGERAEDLFHLSDADDRPLDDAAQSRLRAALLERIDLPERIP